MTEFGTEYRHYCRNPKCRTKLPTPISNPREAFCPETTCRERFYRLRCYACEEKKPGRLDAHTCGRRKCKNALRVLGPPYDSRRVEIASGNPIKSGLPEGPKSRLDKWRILAGEISPEALHCATVPDGPDCKWDGGSYERTEAQNRRLLKAHFAKLAEKALIQPGDMPVNLLGGFRSNYRALKLGPEKSLKTIREQAAKGLPFNDPDAPRVPDPVITGIGYDRHLGLPKPQVSNIAQIPDDLGIPDFLRR